MTVSLVVLFVLLMMAGLSLHDAAMAVPVPIEPHEGPAA
jgi:hypothetical protein